MAVAELSEENCISILPKGEQDREVGAQPEREGPGRTGCEIAQPLRGIETAKLAAHAGEAGSGDQLETHAGLGEEVVMAGQFQGGDGVPGPIHEIPELGFHVECDHRQTGAAAVGEAVHEAQFPRRKPPSLRAHPELDRRWRLRVQ